MFSMSYGTTFVKLPLGGRHHVWVNASHIVAVEQDQTTTKAVCRVSLVNGEAVHVMGLADDLVTAFCKRD